MKSNAETDKIYVEKIIKYIDDIKHCFEHFNISSHNDFKAERISQFAVTQIITNIYEVKKKITPETLLMLPEFDKLKIAGARNIASHDYEQVNFRIVYDICNMLMSEEVLNDLNGVNANAEADTEHNNGSCE